MPLSTQKTRKQNLAMCGKAHQSPHQALAKQRAHTIYHAHSSVSHDQLLDHACSQVWSAVGQRLLTTLVSHISHKDGIAKVNLTLHTPNTWMQSKHLKSRNWKLMGDLSTSSNEFWDWVQREVEVKYSEWLLATPLARLRIKVEEQVSPRFQRLDQRASSALLAALPDPVRRDIVASRRVATQAILYKLFTVYTSLVEMWNVATCFEA